MADFPALPLWTDAYLADTRHLTHAEHGRYLLMLMDMWRMPEKRFPNDDAWLARKFGCSTEDIKALFRPLLEEFFQTNGNWLCQKRLAREWHRLRGTSTRQSDNAKSGWRKRKAVSHGNAALALQPQPEPQPVDSSESHPSVRASYPTSVSHTNGGAGGAPNGAARGRAENSRKRGSRMPDDWDPGDEGRAWAKAETELSRDRIETVTDSFRDWALSATGPKAVKLNWNRAWKNAVRREDDRLREQARREQQFRDRYQPVRR